MNRYGMYALWLTTCLMVAPAGGRGLALQDDALQSPLAPRLQNLGTLHHKVTTVSERAQLFFDQGLRLVYGFNHYEAIRSFREASRLDPDCAMAYWGEALALGPNINDPMPHERELEAHDAIQKALKLKSRVSEKERLYIDALARRYSRDPNADRKALDQAFVDAMREVARRFPEDPDALTIYAAAIMETMPWDYWTRDGKPQAGTEEVIRVLEGVMKKFPDHPGAHHYYIHIVEASTDPDRGIPSADKLAGLMPGAGHLVHMPAHIYIRVGRYADASESNVRAIEADEDYIAQCQAQGLYPTGYYPHNIHFLWSAATMEGRSAVAIDAARKVAAKIPPALLHEMHSLQDFISVPLYAFTRFGRWDEILSEPKPLKELSFVTGVWHYARGIAFSAKGDLGRAQKELEDLKRIAAEDSLKDVGIQFTPARTVLTLAAKIVEGELAAKQNQMERAIRLLEEAVALQDDFRYSEPPAWHYPVRQSLGAVLLEAGKPAEAERVYQEDLQMNRENGWSLFGLMQSLRAQGKKPEAARAEIRFRKAWSRADVALTSSRF